jgi:ABC-type Fe3+ transport system permease subunit
MASRKSNSPIILLTVTGFVIGGGVGFLLRPSAFLIGQLPIDIVITRGIFLRGLDRVMIPLAESSFNQMLTVAVIGALVGTALACLISRR